MALLREPQRTLEQAMQALAASKPDLILMDVVMPGQNGFQLTRAMCEILITQIFPIIILHQ